MSSTATPREIERALRLVENQRRASKAYYERHKEAIKTKATNYWENHKESINEKRRQRYAIAHPPVLAEPASELK